MAQKTKHLRCRRWNQEQSWYWESVWSVRGRTVKTSIRRNAYDDQSHKRAYIFDGDKWNLVIDWPIDQSFAFVTYTRKEIPPEQIGIFTNACEEMIGEIELIIDTNKEAKS